MKNSPSEKLIVTYLIKDFPAFHGIQSFDHSVHKHLSLHPTQSQMNPVNTFISYF
jgi:hypothetical protein